MTCIVGVPTPGGSVIMAGDSAAVGGLSLTVRADEKVFENGDFVMGFTTSYRMGQLLRYKLTPPPCRPGRDPLEYLSTDFIDSVRKCLGNGGWRWKENEREEGGTFLIGYLGRVYYVDRDFHVGEAVAGFDAVGSGSDVALGALHALSDEWPNMDPWEKALRALEAAERCNAGVRGPFHMVEGGWDVEL